MQLHHSAQKHAKEAFVSGHTGTTLHEITCISCLPILASYLCSRSTVLHPAWLQAAVLVSLCTAALMSQHGITLCCVCAAITLAVHRFSTRQQHETSATAPREQHPQPGPTHQLWLSQYRGALMLLTCIAILAVDFNAFPRRFVKTEMVGTGLMDTGVGAFVFSSTCTAAFGAAQLSSSRHVTLRRQRALLRGLVLLLLGKVMWVCAKKKLCVQTVCALPCAGLARVLATGAVDYQQHVGEYGVYWNFFFTLALAAQPVHVLLADAISPVTLFSTGVQG